MNIWCVVLNWNGLDDTLACLRTLDCIDKPDHVSLTILVIDNHSNVDPSISIKQAFPAVQVERMDRNYGFAGGCNHGVRIAVAAGADHVLLLNNDTLVAEDFLNQLVNALRSEPAAAAVAPAILYADADDVVWFAGARAMPALGFFEHQFLNRPVSKIPERVFCSDYLTGCCMLIRVASLSGDTLFDDRYFAYFEDAELSLRLRKRGWQLLCQPTARIWHKESASTRASAGGGLSSPLKHYFMERNRILTIHKHGTLADKIGFFAVGLPLRVVYLSVGLLMRRRFSKLAWLWNGVYDGVLKRYEIPAALLQQ